MLRVPPACPVPPDGIDSGRDSAREEDEDVENSQWTKTMTLLL